MKNFAERFRKARTPQEEQRYLLALAGFRQPELIDKTLARTLNGEVRTQDSPFLLRAAANERGRPGTGVEVLTG